MRRQREAEERKSLLQKESMMPRITNLIDMENGYTVRASSKRPSPDQNILSPNTSNSENEMDLDARYTLGLDTDLECDSEVPKFSSNVSTQASSNGVKFK